MTYEDICRQRTEAEIRIRRASKWYDGRISEFQVGEYHKDYIIVTTETLDKLAEILLKPTSKFALKVDNQKELKE